MVERGAEKAGTDAATTRRARVDERILKMIVECEGLEKMVVMWEGVVSKLVKKRCEGIE